MKKIVYLLAFTFVLMAVPCFAAPPGGGHGPGGPGMGGRAPMMHGGISASRAPMGRPPMGGGMHRPTIGGPHHIGGRPLPPPMYRPMPLVYRPYYYSSLYYPSYYSTYYSYYPETYYDDVVTPVSTANTVVVRDNYAGINTAANVINTAANVAATIRYLTW